MAKTEHHRIEYVQSGTSDVIVETIREPWEDVRRRYINLKLWKLAEPGTYKVTRVTEEDVTNLV